MATPPCPLGRLRTFHIPKTGSSFSSLVWAYGCAAEDGGYAVDVYHYVKKADLR